LTSPQHEPSPLYRAWNIFSAIAGVIGTAGMIDDLANWAGLIQTVVRGYGEIVHPILHPITLAINFPEWFSDYLFVGLMVAGARARPTYNHMNGYWLFDASQYKWYAFWAPHRLATFVMSIFMTLLWPLLLITFLPRSVLKIDEKNTFQLAVWRDQFHWLVIYGLSLVGLFISNAGLKALANAAAK